jgi:hypothetical protein
MSSTFSLSRWTGLVVLASVLLFAGCRTATTSVKTLLDDPGRYDGKTVQISGEVTGAVGVLGYGGYRVDDGTGSILVVTKTGGAPREGAKVGVEGVFRSGFTLGAQTAAVIEESRRFEP